MTESYFRLPRCDVCGKVMSISIEKKYLPLEVLVLLEEYSASDNLVTQWECFNLEHGFKWSILTPHAKTIWVD